MGIEYFYQFIDRAVVDPMLQMNWVDFLREYPWPRDSLQEFLAFAVEPEPDFDAVSRILDERSLRWTMKRSYPSYYFLHEVIHHAPCIKNRCPEFWPESFYEGAVLEATAVEAFIQGRIGKQTLWTVYNMDGGWIQLSRAKLTRVRSALDSVAIQKPIFSWQTDNCLRDGYSCLRLADTKRFITFLTQAWQENWPVPSLRNDVREDLAKMDAVRMNAGTPHFRDFDLTQNLVACVSDTRLDRPCVLRYFG